MTQHRVSSRAEAELSDAEVEGSPEVCECSEHSTVRGSEGILRLGPRRASLRMTAEKVGMETETGRETGDSVLA
jgi:hypothetical protein